ncbi:MAG: peptidase S1 [Acidobacteria bacterium]|nr:MAG: peptidase S1 [Acidobacteriota bacterium]
MPRSAFSVILLILASGLWSLDAQTKERPAEGKPPDALRDLSTSLETLARRAGNAVVQIFSTGYAFSDEGDSGNASLLSRQRSSGSGVILSADGYIVTNAHVVQGGRRIRVQLPQSLDQPPGHSVLRPAGPILDAKTVGIDRESDLAVIKIGQTDLPFLRFGHSEDLRQGQIVLAMGNPLGLANSVSMGVVSSVARQLKPDDTMIYIQTDAPINPGNSGGPLLDTEGRVIGINTLILSQSGGSEGIGFAIPSNIVSNVVRQLQKDGHVHRGEIGVYAQTITPALATGLGLPRGWGALLGDVMPGGPADEAGLKIGDIALTLNDKVIENARQLEVNLYGRPIGDKVTLEVLRGDQKMRFDVAVIERDNDPQRFADLVKPEENIVSKLGIIGVEITAKIAEMVQDLRTPRGVIVAARAAGAPFFGAELHAGDVIYAVNGRPISSVASLRQALDDTKAGKPIILQIEREGRLKFLDLELE